MPDTIYLLYDPDDYWQQYDARAAAEDAFDITVAGMTQDAIDDGEWHDDIETVALYRADRIRGVRMVQTGHADERGEAMEIEEIDDPPPADAALLAAANRALVERLQRARDEETTRAHAAELHRNDVVERLRLMEERAEKAERERDKAQAMLDAMTLLSCSDFDGIKLRVRRARRSIADLGNPELDETAREEIARLFVEECRDLCTDIDRLLAHIVALQRQLASAEAWRDIEATRRADAPRELALGLGCTEPPKKGQCVIDPTGAVFFAPAIPLGAGAEARVDAWRREHEPCHGCEHRDCWPNEGECANCGAGEDPIE